MTTLLIKQNVGNVIQIMINVNQDQSLDINVYEVVTTRTLKRVTNVRAEDLEEYNEGGTVYHRDN